MRERILRKLKEIENTEQVKILFAVESGSRAWGFPSQDSDYDVRFVYIHRPEWYLSIERRRDVIEYPIDDLLDINGWDIKKALGLLRKYNPALMEWLDSSIVYQENYQIRERMKEIRSLYFARKTSMYHYLNMAASNYRTYLKGDTVKAKKYFYVLRPLFACMWLEHEDSHPPLPFSVLMDAALKGHSEIKQKVEALLVRKMAGDELRVEPRLDMLNQFIEDRLEYLNNYAKGLLADEYCSMERLNEFFLKLLQEVWQVKIILNN